MKHDREAWIGAYTYTEKECTNCQITVLFFYISKFCLISYTAVAPNLFSYQFWGKHFFHRLEVTTGVGGGMVLHATWIPCMHRWSFAHFCSLIPNRLLTRTSLWPGCWGPLLYTVEWSIEMNSQISQKVEDMISNISWIMLKAIKYKEVFLTAKPHVRIWNIETNRCAIILDHSSEESLDEIGSHCKNCI